MTGTPKPWLAKSWTSSPDGKTWTFTLTDNVKFHDGMPLTSEDVKFTFDYNLTGPGNAAGAAQGVIYTPGCPPCGVTGNKRHLHAGNADPAPAN